MHITSHIRLLSVLSLIVGSSLTFGSLDAVNASISGPGSTMLESHAMEAGASLTAVPLHSAPVDIATSIGAGIQLIFGLLFILLGFFLHAFLTSNGERNVPVKVKTSKQKKASWFWVEMRF